MGPFTLRNKPKNSIPHSSRKEMVTHHRPIATEEPSTQLEPSKPGHLPISSRKGAFLKLYLADVGYSTAARGTPDKNSCNHISFCWPHRSGDVGRFLSLLGSQQGNVCCLLPTVMCPIKPKRGLLSIERSTWHI